MWCSQSQRRNKNKDNDRKWKTEKSPTLQKDEQRKVTNNEWSQLNEGHSSCSSVLWSSLKSLYCTLYNYIITKSVIGITKLTLGSSNKCFHLGVRIASIHYIKKGCITFLHCTVQLIHYKILLFYT